MKFLFYLTFIIAFFSQATHSQVTEYRPMISSMQILEKKEISSGNIEGSPYLESEFLPGTLLQKNKDSHQFYFRYNALNKQVEIKVKPQDKKVYVLPNSSSTIYELKDYSYQYRNFSLAGKSDIFSYFLLLYESDNILFIGSPELNIIGGTEKKSGFGTSKPSRYETEINWYLKKGEEDFTEVRLKEKDFKNFFSSAKMEEYFDDHKIKTKSDVVKMLKYYENNE